MSRALVLGAAVSGTAAARLLRALGTEAAVYDARAAAVAGLRDEGFEVHSGEWAKRLLGSADLVVASPGFAEHSPPIADTLAAGVPLWSELELAARHLEAPLVAVTGTNGKTTVTRLIAEMLQRSGRTAIAAGNIGTALSEVALQRGSWDVVVVEASSFQLRFTVTFQPEVAVVLNVAPDHLDWHGDFDRYLAAKARIHHNQGPDDVLVYDADDAGAAAVAAGADARLIPVSGRRRPAGGAGPENGRLWVGDEPLDLGGIADPGPAYLADLAAAAAAAMAAGSELAGVAAAIAGFSPGPHRRSVIGMWGGVTWVDDSKATNPHAAAAAAAAYPSVVLVAGGRNKGLDLSSLVEAPSVRRVVAIGEAAAELAALGGHKVVRAGSMVEAVAAAAELARPGDTVLLAPGCASFDMFSGYAQRGDVFAAAVRASHEGAS